MPESDVFERAEAILGYRFNDRSLLAAALTHASIAEHRLRSNERLEFLGDAILAMVVCDELFRQFPDLLEGELTKIKSTVVSRSTCAEVSRAMNLPELLFLGKGMSGRSRLPSSLCAAVFESVTAAIFIDGGGIEVARRFILEHMGEQIRLAAESEHKRNYKSQLQQYSQRILNGTPTYDMLDEQGPDHSKCFEVCVAIHGRRFPPAWGPSKKEAEQRAAYNALMELNQIRLTGASDPLSPFERETQEAAQSDDEA